jgi:hypothetical protein
MAEIEYLLGKIRKIVALNIKHNTINTYTHTHTHASRRYGITINEKHLWYILVLVYQIFLMVLAIAGLSYSKQWIDLPDRNCWLGLVEQKLRAVRNTVLRNSMVRHVGTV